MVKRRKRLEKGVSSLGEQIQLHYLKRDRALEEKKVELARYYEREIEAREETRLEKEKILERLRKKKGS